MTLMHRLSGAIAGMLLAGSAVAAPFGTLSFIDPTGVVSATDSVPVWARVTLDPGSPALTLDDPVPGF